MMTTKEQKFPRGAEWRQWDFHVHTPASFHWNSGKRLSEMTDAEKKASVDQMISAINGSDPAVFVLMDYWTFDGWFALRKRLEDVDAPTLNKKVFPGIELRLVSPTKYRLNAHVIFSDDITNQDLINFKAKLEVALINQPLSDECLIRLAREKIGNDLLIEKGFKPDDVKTDTKIALKAGSTVAEITEATYRDAINRVPDGKAIGFMPWDTHDGLAKADWKTHYAYVIGLMNTSPIFETRRQDLWAAFSGIKTDENSEWFDAFQMALDSQPRLAVSGSDAHSYNDYGKFPSGRSTWIKADPTFLGLLQAIKEPGKRSYIGARPQKIDELAENKTYFIEHVEIKKTKESQISEHWLADIKVPLNADLVAIIGNKGSGKSALADVIALLGNSRQKAHFSFLKKGRFQGRSGEPAKHFIGKIAWFDGSVGERNLNDDLHEDKVELIRYIPQGHFESLCNDLVSGRSNNEFERELRKVIFSHAGDEIRLGAHDFDQLIEKQESSVRDQLGEFRKELKKLNQEIAWMEAQLQPDLRRSLQELLSLKQKQIEEHNKIKPEVATKPSEQLTAEQQQASTSLEVIANKLKEIEARLLANTNSQALLAAKSKAIQAVRERLRILERQYKQFDDETAKDLEILGLNLPQIATLTIHGQALDQLGVDIPQQRQSLLDNATQDVAAKQLLLAEQSTLSAKLNAPQLLYQQKLKAIELWEDKLRELIGTDDTPESLKGLEARITQLDMLPSMLNEKKGGRLRLSEEIFDILDTQRKAREELFKPVQDLIKSNSLIREDYKLQFQATLGGSSEVLASSLFELIKQNSRQFKGEDAFATVRKLYEQFDLNKKEGCFGFLASLHEQIINAAKGESNEAIGIASILRKDKQASEVYDLLFGLSFLEPRYSLLFQDTQIEQLSPGQRGALLLIFYLLVDKGRTPIILDQPEENLDNETVVNLLVPVLSEAKRRRQIIMVTHNPNLAVVCDAEQVIHSSFDRKNLSRISYVSGSIENPVINVHVVNVLEGTKPAFDNRRIKYH